MSPTPNALASGRPAINPHGEGDDHTFSGTCAYAGVCQPGGYDKTALAELHCLIEHTEPIPAGQHIFRVNDPFLAVYAVRAGTVKTYVVDDEGREQVLGFFLPGELIGLDAIHPAHYPCNAVALDTVTLCRFSFPAIAALAARVPNLQAQLFRPQLLACRQRDAVTADIARRCQAWQQRGCSDHQGVDPPGCDIAQHHQAS